jgi:hypothetical protein
MMSRITATVPAPVVVLLRGALYTDLQRTCEEAPATSPEYKTRAGWTPVFRRIDAAVGGLDAIGWDEPDEQEALTVALDAAMVDALERDAELWGWLSEQERTESAEGRARAAEHAAAIELFLASLTERPAAARLVISTAALPLVREGAREAIGDVSDSIDGGVHPRECCRRLGAICDLLDLIGWSDEDEPTEDVDATEHARAVIELAPPMLETLRTGVNDLDDTDPSKATAEDELRLMREVHTQASEARDG